MNQGILNGQVAIAQPADGRVRIEHARPGGKLDGQQVLAVPHEARGRGLLEMHHASVVGDCRVTAYSIGRGLAEIVSPPCLEGNVLGLGCHRLLIRSKRKIPRAVSLNLHAASSRKSWCPFFRSSTGHPRWAATRLNRRSGFTAAGRPTASNMCRSEMLSE